MKGNVEEELTSSQKAIKELYYKIENIVDFKLPIEESKRTLINLKKISHTDKKYPREFSKIKKNEL